jgi:tetratricopeptide (TPR) repeat protein
MRVKVFIAGLLLLLLAATAGLTQAVLYRYSAGETERALESLTELESATLVEFGPKVVEPMWRAKLAVIADLIAKTDAEVLTPVTLLHQQAYVCYIELDRSALAVHSRTMAMELTEVYADKIDTEKGHILASNLMASLAGYMQEAYLESPAALLYSRALEFHPTNIAALQGLAGMYERRGEYDQAVARLEELVAAHPKNREGRLRLAINLARLHREREAASFLSGLVEEAVPDWILSLAHQELARMLADNGDLAEALKLLKSGMNLLPGDPSLPIQLAYLADREGVPGEAPDLGAALSRSSRSESESPRYLYSQIPKSALAQLRLSLEDRSDKTLVLLATALGGSPQVEMES